MYKMSKSKIIGFLVEDEDGKQYTIERKFSETTAIFDDLCAYSLLLERHAVELADKREHFIGVYMDARSRVICTKVLSIGTMEAALVHPREVLSPCLEHGATSLLVAHNHPSGDPTPSPEDIALTHRLRKACEIMGIKFLDHLVIGDKHYTSITREAADFW